MARYKLTLAYDGTAFLGSQRQSRRRTVQAELETAARRLGWKGRAILLAGRTDTGVHASGQVAALDHDWRHPVASLRDAFNAGLPADLAVVDAAEVKGDFHPRFDAVSRRYVYRLHFAAVRNPLADRDAWRVWPGAPLDRLRTAARWFLGKHDFGAFGSAPKRNGSTERTVIASDWSAQNDGLCYEIAADGFLYRMVRRLVFVQVSVGQAKCTEAAVRRALESGRRSSGLPAGLAPANGLTLVEVEY